MNLKQVLSSFDPAQLMYVATKINQLADFQLLAAHERDAAQDDDPSLDTINSILTAVLLKALANEIDPELYPEPLPKMHKIKAQYQPRERKKRGVYLEAKMINGSGPYIYRRWHEGGKFRSQYVGKLAPD